MDPQPGFDGVGFDLPQYNVQQAQRLYSAYNVDAPGATNNIKSTSMYGDLNDANSYDENDPKRRRIARVSTPDPLESLADRAAGLRYVPKKEDQVRWEDAEMLTLPQLQD